MVRTCPDRTPDCYIVGFFYSFGEFGNQVIGFEWSKYGQDIAPSPALPQRGKGVSATEVL